VLSYRFGFGKNDVPHSLEETGQKFGWTRERIRQIENKAFKWLRYYTNIKK
jgi:DNA-directed RNA polymerase sigma subunit (sigma70/sigma32)